MILEKISIKKNNAILPKQKPEKNWKKLFIYLLLIVTLLVFAGLLFEEVVEKDEHGVYHLRQERKDKLYKDSVKMEEKCVQYALIAQKSNFYPCLNCVGKDSIFLLEGEIYKYGFTCNGEQIRYRRNDLEGKGLFFLEQFRGNIQECMFMELRKIIEYPLLPENLKRLPADRLARPAGNPYDK